MRGFAILVIALLMMLYTVSGFSQAYNDAASPQSQFRPVTPSTAEFQKFGFFDMDYSTGVPNITIPIFNISVGDFTLPISLQYHASGIPICRTVQGRRPSMSPIGDLSTDESLQRFKFEDKELDRNYGLDWYDIQARQYDGLVPGWNRPDDKAHDYTPINPYAYCAGDPVNRRDYDGCDWITATYAEHVFYCWDEQVHGQDDITNRYYYGDDVNEQKIQYVGSSGLGSYNGSTISLNDDGSYSIDECDPKTVETNEGGLHIGSIPQGTIPSGNYYGNYLGSNNPGKGKSYCTPPIDGTDYAANRADCKT